MLVTEWLLVAALISSVLLPESFTVILQRFAPSALDLTSLSRGSSNNSPYLLHYCNLVPERFTSDNLMGSCCFSLTSSAGRRVIPSWYSSMAALLLSSSELISPAMLGDKNVIVSKKVKKKALAK